MSARPHPFHTEYKNALAAGLPCPAEGLQEHRWRVSHVDAAGQRRRVEVAAATSEQAMNGVEQLYGVPRAGAAIRLTPETPTH